MEPELVHATAIVIGSTGLLLVGPSGSGKSTKALQLMSTARRAAHFAALVSDDQVFLEIRNDRVIATAPATIRGKIEVRGTGIAAIPSIDLAELNYVVRLEFINASNRIPNDDAIWTSAGGISLPLITLDRSTPDPYAVLEAFLPGFPVLTPNS
ncbi:HPr kinase/phosphorylase [Rhizobium alvei]|uniref:HPr kinase/phosphatase C-terminal domain-containing protein n=1 Tax=Rhizobium alvei TaxID=1132659 RepID=A0ABT8YLU4_9HYPH|nr:HPr kinase/phosphatase C-terminal domain-containing protein [Rhizobium alvei]MDO6964699.1 HPr kinase/phosphatase C-terminal domain-containing protein [Rhizobium alvei]